MFRKYDIEKEMPDVRAREIAIQSPMIYEDAKELLTLAPDDDPHIVKSIIKGACMGRTFQYMWQQLSLVQEIK